MSTMLERPAGALPSPDQLRRFFLLANDLLAVFDPRAGRFLIVNPAFSDLLGYSAVELTTRPLAAFVCPADLADTEAQVAACLAAGRLERYENRYRGADGGTRVVRWRAEYDADEGLIQAVGKDVTAEHAARDALARGEARLSAFLEHTPMPVFIKDRAGRHLYANRALRELFGDDRPYLGRFPAEIWAPETATALEEDDRAVLDSGRATLFHERVDLGTGPREFLVSKFPLPAPDGGILLAGVAIDVTDSKRAEAATREAERRARLALDAAGMGLWDWDVPRRSIVWNRAHFDLLGVPVQEGGVVHESIFFECVHPDDRARFEGALRRAVTDADEFCDVCRVVRGDGAVRWIRASARIFRDGAGRAERVIGVTGDITDIKVAEQALRDKEQFLRLAQSIAEVATFEWFPQSNVQHSSPNLQQMYALAAPITRFDDVLDAALPEDRELLRQAVARWTREGAQRFEVDFRVRGAGGGVRWLTSRGRIERDGAGLPSRFLGVVIDITARRVAEEHLRLALAAGELSAWDWDPRSDAVNWRFVSHVGPDRRLPATGSEALATIHPEDRSRLLALCTDLPARGGRGSELLRVPCRDGSVRWRRAHVSLMPGTSCVTGVVRDVTAECHALAALAESDRRARVAMETAGLATWDWDVASDAVRWNFEYFRSAMPPLSAQATSAAFRALVHPADLPAHEAALAHALASGEPLRDTFRLVVGGREHWVRSDGVVARDQATGAVAMTGTLLDVTELKRAELDAVLNEARYRGLFDASLDALCVTDRNSLRILDVNAAFERIYGWRREDLLGRSVVTVSVDQQVARAALQGPFPYRRICRHRRADGTQFPVEVHASSYRIGDQHLVIGAVRDISERMAVEAQLEDHVSALHATLEATADGILSIGLDGQVKHWNQRFLDIWGVAPATVAGASYARLRAGLRDLVADGAGWEQRLDAIDERPLAESRDTLSLVDGRIIERCSRPQLVDGRPVARVWSFRDVTHQRRIEAALEALAAGTAGTGQAFFDALTRELCHALGVCYAMVGSLVAPDAGRVRTLSQFCDGRYLDAVEYDLAGTPCEAVVAGRTCFYQGTAQREFPCDPVLGLLDCDSYLGASLRSSGGVQLGLIAVLARAPFDEGMQPRRIIEIFAARAAAELERLATEEALRASESRYRTVLEAIHDGVTVVQDGRVVYANHGAERMLGYAAGQLVGVPLSALTAAALRAEIEAGLERIETGASCSWASELRVLGEDAGESLWIDARCRSIEYRGRPALLSSFQDITERRQMQDKLRRAVAELALTGERERRELAGMLHDHVVQDLALAKLTLGQLPPPRGRASRAACEELRALLDKTVREARTLMFEISPPVLYELGLGATLEWLIERFSAATGIATEFCRHGADAPLSTEQQVTLFQTARELLANVRKHADAGHVTVSCTVSDGLFTLAVADDGCGFDTAAQTLHAPGEKFGLYSLHDRLDLFGGDLHVRSQPGQGTTVEVTLPFNGAGHEPGLAQSGDPWCRAMPE
ncbi:MAG: PAS domain S-box protein [Gammaproteobacteria bacterium]|nr:PAS domain S-box protein [Gammaproteobacteria bacterium]